MVAKLPVLDGSSLDFTRAILKSGIAKQGKTVPVLRIKKPFVYEEAVSRIIAKPHNGFKITYKIFYDHPLIMEQSLSLEINEQNFMKEVSPARTFGF